MVRLRLGDNSSKAAAVDKVPEAGARSPSRLYQHTLSSLSSLSSLSLRRSFFHVDGPQDEVSSHYSGNPHAILQDACYVLIISRTNKEVYIVNLYCHW